MGSLLFFYVIMSLLTYSLFVFLTFFFSLHNYLYTPLFHEYSSIKIYFSLPPSPTRMLSLTPHYIDRFSISLRSTCFYRESNVLYHSTPLPITTPLHTNNSPPKFQQQLLFIHSFYGCFSTYTHTRYSDLIMSGMFYIFLIFAYYKQPFFFNYNNFFCQEHFYVFFLNFEHIMLFIIFNFNYFISLENNFLYIVTPFLTLRNVHSRQHKIHYIIFKSGMGKWNKFNHPRSFPYTRGMIHLINSQVHFFLLHFCTLVGFSYILSINEVTIILGIPKGWSRFQLKFYINHYYLSDVWKKLLIDWPEFKHFCMSSHCTHPFRFINFRYNITSIALGILIFYSLNLTVLSILSSEYYQKVDDYIRKEYYFFLLKFGNYRVVTLICND